MLHLLEGPVKVHITKDRKRKKAHHLPGIEPTNSLLWGVRSTAMCSTTVLQPLPKITLSLKPDLIWSYLVLSFLSPPTPNDELLLFSNLAQGVDEFLAKSRQTNWLDLS